MRVLVALAAGGLLVAAAPTQPLPKPKVALAPADDTPAQPVGAAARAKRGPEPLAKPPVDVGSAEDPAPVPGAPEMPPVNPPK